MTNRLLQLAAGDTADDSPARQSEVLARVAQALDGGVVTPRDVEMFLDRAAAPRRAGERPTAALVLYTVGAVVVFGGLALAYFTIFGDLPRALRLTTPFLFPIVALAACLTLRRRRFAAWRVELAGVVAYVALAGACVAVGAASGWLGTDHDVALYTAVCASIAAVLVIAVFAEVRSIRLLVLGLGAALAALGVSLAELAGVLREGTWSWVLLAEAAAAAMAALLLVRRNRHACEYVAYWATAGVWASAVAGTSAAGPEDFSIWHVTLAAGIVVAFLVAGTMNFNGLLWLAALAGLQWLQAIAILVGSATNAAFAVVLAGLGLVGLGLLVTKLNRRIRPAG
jgi:hypothetical protein